MCSLQRNYDVIRNWERFETGPLTVVMFKEATQGLTNPDVNRKRMHQVFCYMTLHVSLFLVLHEVFHIYKFTQVRCSLCTENKSISTEVSETLMRCAKNCIFQITVLIKCVIYMISLSLESIYPISILAVRQQ